jgi:hypothetical protein
MTVTVMKGRMSVAVMLRRTVKRTRAMRRVKSTANMSVTPVSAAAHVPATTAVPAATVLREPGRCPRQHHDRQ